GGGVLTAGILTGMLVSGKSVAKEVPAVKWSAQEKHFPGHNSYTPGRSVLTSDPRKLAESAGTGQQVGNIPVGMPGSKERVNFGGSIGTYIDGAGVATPTANGIIHYSKDGIHIVPARP
ncbi:MULTISPECIES: polymorphic toxin type 50 domain-containing protein, partial [Pseudomonas]